ncbi:MAG: hypothetical protein ACRC5C_00550 [Bacilli bacterium]
MTTIITMFEKVLKMKQEGRISRTTIRTVMVVVPSVMIIAVVAMMMSLFNGSEAKEPSYFEVDVNGSIMFATMQTIAINGAPELALKENNQTVVYPEHDIQVTVETNYWGDVVTRITFRSDKMEQIEVVRIVNEFITKNSHLKY